MGLPACALDRPPTPLRYNILRTNMPNSRRHFLTLLAATTACRKPTTPTAPTPGAPPAFGTSPDAGPPISPATFTEAVLGDSARADEIPHLEDFEATEEVTQVRFAAVELLVAIPMIHLARGHLTHATIVAHVLRYMAGAAGQHTKSARRCYVRSIVL